MIPFSFLYCNNAVQRRESIGPGETNGHRSKTDTETKSEFIQI